MRLKVQPKADPQNCQSERGGAMLLFLALGLAATLIGVAALTVNIGLTSSIRSEMRNAVDASAQAAVAMMCSTRECYESAKLEALKSLELLLPPFLDDQRRSTPIRLDPDGGPEWQVGDLTVRFERGRWFSDGPPPQMESIISTHPNLQFEPFDLVDASEPS
ncbi:MAG: hypothetical protein GX589_01835, partial [Deltaproteobacteria bacterium]|nr:hypothetical protein [Deltaproteobacteria bacterium]